MRYQKNDKRPWVSACKAGRAEFCPHYLELEHKKHGVSKKAAAARIKGDAKHDALNKRAGEDKRCYVASHLYGVDDERTVLLRAYRDNRLKASSPGQLFIKVYYRLSPALIVIARKVPIVDQILKASVDKIILRLRRK